MSITVTDPALLAELMRVTDVVEIKHPDGRVLGHFAVENLGVPPPGVTSPFTEAERAERRKQRTGRKLEDILRDLEKRG